MNRRLAGAAIALLSTQLMGFAPFSTDPVRDGNRLYKEGKYDEAKSKYGEALVDDPDSPLLNFNMGDAHYKAGNFADAVASYSRVATGGDVSTEAAVAFNIGNAHFQNAVAQESEKPQDALKSYAEALVAYRRAVGADPAHTADARYNYELSLKKLKDLQKKLEEQKQQDQQQQQDQPQDQQPQDQQPQDQQQDQQQAQDQQQEQPSDDQAGQDQPEEKEQPEQKDQPQGEDPAQPEDQDQPQQAQQPQGGEPGEEPQGEEQGQATAAEKAGEKTQAQREAAALIDMAADEELQPDEFARKVQGAGVVEPAQDW